MIQTGQVALACEYLSPRLVPEAKPILQLVKLGLGETHIYRERNRNTSSRLAQDAEVIIGSHLEKNGVAVSLERSFPLARMSAQPYSGRDNVDLRVQLNTS